MYIVWYIIDTDSTVGNHYSVPIKVAYLVIASAILAYSSAGLFSAFLLVVTL